jgi:hypothetical protein
LHPREDRHEFCDAIVGRCVRRAGAIGARFASETNSGLRGKRLAMSRAVAATARKAASEVSPVRAEPMRLSFT